jgi:hypothetical protein
LFFRSSFLFVSWPAELCFQGLKGTYTHISWPCCAHSCFISCPLYYLSDVLPSSLVFIGGISVRTLQCHLDSVLDHIFSSSRFQKTSWSIIKYWNLYSVLVALIYRLAD